MTTQTPAYGEHPNGPAADDPAGSCSPTNGLAGGSPATNDPAENGPAGDTPGKNEPTGNTPGKNEPTGNTTGRNGPPRGRPRSEEARRAVLGAAAELLLDRGLSAVSMDAVAERAGVSKATIYRWWPTKETLALDALYTHWAAAQPDPGDTGSLRGDLLELVRPWVRLAASRPYGRVIAALISEAQTDPVFAAEYQRRVVQPRRAQAAAIFRRAVERGEIPPDTEIDVAIDLLYGPLYHRLLHAHAPLTERFAAQVVDMLLDGLRPSTGR